MILWVCLCVWFFLFVIKLIIFIFDFFRCSLFFYEVKDKSICVRCSIGDVNIMLRCKIWFILKNIGLNKVEVLMNDVVFWKKGFWWYNVKSSWEFMIGNDIKLIVVWYVILWIKYDGLVVDDFWRSLGFFCVEYLVFKDNRK